MSNVPSRILSMLLVSGLGTSGSGLDAQESSDVTVPDSPEDPTGSTTADPPVSYGAGLVLEEVIVYRDRSLNSLRREMYTAEEAFYDAFNAVNSDDEFDVRCRRSAIRGSRITRRVCEARFVRDLNADYAQAWLRGEPLPTINAMLMHKGQQLVDEMRAAATENAAVLESLMELARTRQRFEQERERRCGDRIFLCRR